MAKYILKRCIVSIFTILAVITLIFFLIRMLPGDPFTSEREIPVAVRQNMLARFGLDKPLYMQYLLYLKNFFLHGDLGPSMKYETRSVRDIILYSFPASAKIGLLVVLASLFAGINMGIVAAMNQGRLPDRSSMFLVTLGVTIPNFVLANLLILFFSIKLKVLPPTGYGGFRYLFMPVVALSGYSTAFIARLTRSKYLEVMQQDYIRTARAKGMSRFSVVFKHAMRNAIIPVITYLGPLVANVLTGSFVVETIFAIPGLGREFVLSISNRDYALILGVSIFYSCFVILCNFLVDVVYVLIDPRIRLGDTGQ
ncbi:MAG: ABC transporter permease [Synergistaceae bacterium]|jgi:oligopeptide transport system permease protein|nr:ABC transporter permease [Synergistaceae bacterium]